MDGTYSSDIKTFKFSEVGKLIELITALMETYKNVVDRHQWPSAMAVSYSLAAAKAIRLLSNQYFH